MTDPLDVIRIAKSMAEASLARCNAAIDRMLAAQAEAEAAYREACDLLDYAALVGLETARGLADVERRRGMERAEFAEAADDLDAWATEEERGGGVKKEVIGFVVREYKGGGRYSNASGWGSRSDARVYCARDREGARQHARKWGAVVVRLVRRAKPAKLEAPVCDLCALPIAGMPVSVGAGRQVACSPCFVLREARLAWDADRSRLESELREARECIAERDAHLARIREALDS
jgi:hypothetical protein